MGYRGLSYSSPSWITWPAPEAELRVLHFSRLLAVSQPSHRFLGYHGKRCVTSQNYSDEVFCCCHAIEGSLIAWQTWTANIVVLVNKACLFFCWKVARVWYTAFACKKNFKMADDRKRKRSGRQGDLHSANRMEGEQNSLVDFTSEISLHQFSFLMACIGDSIFGALKEGKRSLLHVLKSWLHMIIALTTDNFPVLLLYT